jgi:hypothetical protein
MELSFKSIALLILALIFIALIFQAFLRPETGILNKAKNSVLGRLAVTIGLINPDKHVEQINVPEELQTGFNNLHETLENIKNAENCFVRYEKIELKSGFKIVITHANEELYMTLWSSQDRRIDIESVPGLTPCVVSGTNNGESMAKNFYSNYLSGEQNTKKTDYSIAKEIVLIKNDIHVILDDKDEKK